MRWVAGDQDGVQRVILDGEGAACWSLRMIQQGREDQGHQGDTEGCSEAGEGGED